MSVSENQAASAGAASTTQRIIKKYPNRRLYDTQTSAYVTLSEVKELVMAAQPLLVRDAKTGEDITRSILLQIILEEEAGGAPIFSETVLSNIIRFYGHAMQGFMGNCLEKNIQLLTDMQTRMAEKSKGITPEMWTQFMAAPHLMSGYTEQSRALFVQMQEQIQKQMQMQVQKQSEQFEQMLGAFGIKR